MGFFAGVVGRVLESGVVGRVSESGVVGGVSESGSGTVPLVGCFVSGDVVSVVGCSVSGDTVSVGCFLLTSVVDCVCGGLVGGVCGGRVCGGLVGGAVVLAGGGLVLEDRYGCVEFVGRVMASVGRDSGA